MSGGWWEAGAEWQRDSGASGTADRLGTSPETEGWRAHSLGMPLPVYASDAFASGWLRRKTQGRPVLVYAAPGTDLAMLADIADRLDP